MIDTGDTAWMLTATALVLFMTLPGLALFYGGLVHSRNVLSALMHCIAIACLASLLWYAFGYTIAFNGDGALFGSLGKAFLAGTDPDDAVGTIPESVFVMYQMTFAIITPGLIVGAYVERIRFGAVLLFSGLWLLIVYAPVAHWVWGGGWLADLGVKDFAGGIVVHVTAGVSALVIAIMLGARRGFPGEVKPPHAPWMVMVGAAILWVGWFGFNAGSAVAAGTSAGMAMLVTHLSAAAASLTWMTIEWARYGKPSLVGLVTGTIAGLATVTPAAGFIGPIGGPILGIAGAILGYLAVDVVKRMIRIDDSLDVLAVHGVGGATGTVLTAFLMAKAFDGPGYAVDISMGEQLGVQVLGVVAVGAFAAVATVVLVFIVRAVIGLRVADEHEMIGLDQAEHGETAYRL